MMVRAAVAGQQEVFSIGGRCGIISGLIASALFLVKVLALVFVRKAMDWCFSKRELSFLDDLMPEGRKKQLADAEEAA